MPQAIEIVRFEVAAEQASAFAAERARADAALAGFDGFLGSELLQTGAESWVLLVRWASRDAALAAQQVTLVPPGVPEIAAWVALARAVRGFDTGDLRHLTSRTSA